jgi:hypothetical protein
MRTDELRSQLHQLADELPAADRSDPFAEIVGTRRRRLQRSRLLSAILAITIAAGLIIALATTSRGGRDTRVDVVGERYRGDTARMSLTLRTDGEPTFALSGTVDFAHEVGALRGTERPATGSLATRLDVQLRWLAGIPYFNEGTAGRWFGWIPATLHGKALATVALPSIVAQPTVSGLLESFRVPRRDVENVGPQVLDRSRLQHGRIVVRAKATIDAFSKRFAEVTQPAGPIVVDFWVRPDHRLQQIVIAQRERSYDAPPHTGMTVNSEELVQFSDFGVAVRVETPRLPPPSPSSRGASHGAPNNSPDVAGDFRTVATAFWQAGTWQYLEAPATGGGTCSAFIFDPPINPGGDVQSASQDPRRYTCRPRAISPDALNTLGFGVVGIDSDGLHDVIAGTANLRVSSIRAVWSDGTTAPVAIRSHRVFVVIWPANGRQLERFDVTVHDREETCIIDDNTAHDEGGLICF